MKRKYSSLCLVTILILLLLFIGLFRWNPKNSITDCVCFNVKFAGGGTQTVSLWDDGTGALYAFLPAGSELDEISVVSDGLLLVNNTEYRNGDVLSGIILNQEYECRYSYHGISLSGRVFFQQADKVSSMFVESTGSKKEPFLARKEQKRQISCAIYTADGYTDYKSGTYKDSISGHGNSTWGKEKNPYNLVLSKEYGLLGMGKSVNWVLLANAMDKSCLKNKIALEFAENISSLWSPECEYVNLYINGDYAGLYLLCERVETGINKVNLNESDFMFTLAGESQKNTYSRLLSSGRWIKIKSGVASREKTVDEMADDLNVIFDKIADIDSDEYLSVIDIESVASKYLVEEILSNYDTNSLCFYTRNSGQILVGGPAWDYDLGLGADDPTFDPQSLYLNKGLFLQLLSHEDFAKYVALKYFDIRDDLIKWVTTDIPEIEEKIQSSREMNDCRFHGGDVWHKNHNAKEICAYLEQRIAFLDKVFLEGKDYHTVILTVNAWNGISNWQITVFDNEVIDASRLALYENDEFSYWLDGTSGSTFDPKELITTDKHLTAVYTEANDNVVVSQLNWKGQLMEAVLDGRVLQYLLLGLFVFFIVLLLKKNREVIK